MNTCNNCRVELEEGITVCPLCGIKSNIPGKNRDNNKRNEFEISTFDFSELSENQKGKLFWVISILILCSIVIVPFIVDLVLNKQITWSKYSIISGLYVFVNITLFSFLYNKIFILLSGSFVSTSLLLLTFDIMNHNIGWGFKLGFPIILLIYFIVFVLIISIKKAKQKGINLVAYFLIAAGVMCICIESIISLHIFETFRLTWSPICLLSVLPVSALFFFIHYKLKRITDLKRFFHI